MTRSHDGVRAEGFSCDRHQRRETELAFATITCPAMATATEPAGGVAPKESRDSLCAGLGQRETCASEVKVPRHKKSQTPAEHSASQLHL